MERSTAGEIIFKVAAYVLVGAFAIICLYPIIYVFSASISGVEAVNAGRVFLYPMDVQVDTYLYIFRDKMFWMSYSNSLFYTFFGTLWSMFVSATGAYVLSKRHLLFRSKINFMVVFTMWFGAGMVPAWLNYKSMGVDNRWGIVVAFGIQAFNIILLRNYFSSVPTEIDEAARIDGANELQVFTRIYLPMSKAALATVTLFYAIARWNGYFWAQMLLERTEDQPLQVRMRYLWDRLTQIYGEQGGAAKLSYSADSLMYAIIICSIIPVLVIYPMIQKYFAKGVNMGGVKG